MPAISSHSVVALQAREWQQTVGHSGMTPTAFSFLIPVFVVAVVAPFLCVFCIKKRRRGAVTVARPPPKVKKPALRRAEARERLLEVTEVSNIAAAGEDGQNAVPETRSVMERECAICLSTLHAPAPPEPAKLSPNTPITDEAAHPIPTSDSTPDLTPTEPETILKLAVCGHEFHAECLVSWFVLRKTSCPICRSLYMSKEAMQQHDDEEQLALGITNDAATLEAQTQSSSSPQTQQQGQRSWRSLGRSRPALNQEQQPIVELQDRTPGQEEAHPVQEAPPIEQPATTRWQRFFTRG